MDLHPKDRRFQLQPTMSKNISLALKTRLLRAGKPRVRLMRSAKRVVLITVRVKPRLIRKRRCIRSQRLSSLTLTPCEARRNPQGLRIKLLNNRRKKVFAETAILKVTGAVILFVLRLNRAKSHHMSRRERVVRNPTNNIL